ncbi:ABC transporter substrate-binding protein [Peptoniphilus equinus]|uniref:ABC transporter substrate-binding protein n=1 Tax=Peptoniphilus equinus TaxID=3016343 RepID=A0ABY7QWL5_9FIRM|nr:ABC transporter substrate-binding protein [Peptoniphilus equinus]WBW50293.1 ABC transporter substrate-binding protein [Peptoniphilus equinus]
MKKVSGLSIKQWLAVGALSILVGCSSNTHNAGTQETPAADATVKIGILQYMDHVSLEAAKEGFVEELKAKGIDAEIIEQSANGDMALTNTMATSMQSEKVDLVYAIATPTAQAAKNTIHDVPIVFSAVTDPVGAQLVESIETPGGNVTGVSDYVSSASQIDAFLKIYPDVKTFGVIYNTSEQNSMVQVEELEANLKERGLALEKVGVNTINDIPQVIATLAPKIDAMFAVTDNMVANAAPIISQTLIEKQIPSLASEEGQVKNGLLMSEGINYKEQGKQAADMAVEILNGTDPASMSVQYNKVNTKTVNETTAKALGIDGNAALMENATVVK